MAKSTILITGGAGYIGSHAVRLLAGQGHKIVVLDNLVYGHRDALVNEAVELVVGDLGDPTVVGPLFERHSFDAVLHFAAYALVGESVSKPHIYYGNNFAAPLALLDAMRENGCDKFIFSSTCATYGSPEYVPIDEKHPQAPINPYGMSKFMLECALKDYGHAYGLKSVILRYFNASGAAEDGLIGEDHDPETHLIPLVLEAVTGERADIKVFGTDYDTPDGSCIRDYIHVEDLAEAHALALDHLLAGKGSLVCNLGTGQGHSVLEVIETVKAVTGKDFKVTLTDRRPGDPARLVADASFAKEALGWEAQRKDLRKIVADAWAWKSSARNGHY